MQAKNVLYAAVGAPVVAVRKVSDQVSTFKGRLSEETASYGKVANETLDEWATEGEKVVSGIREGKVVEEISQKVDLDQAKEQVSKLRDQLEDMLATWRQSFRPESAEEAAPAKPADKTSAGKTSGKTAAKKPATKTSAAKTTPAKGGKSSTAAKKSTANKTPAEGAPAEGAPAKGGATKAKSTS